MKKIILLLSFLFVSSCSTNYYKYSDYAVSCVEYDEEDKEERCLPIDIDDRAIKYHKLQPWEGRRTKPMPEF